jgi:hypothetical protein
MRRFMLTSLAGVLLAACLDAPAAPPDEPAASELSLSSAQSATGRGAVIERGLVALGFIMLDERESLTSVIGLTAAELADFCITGNTQPHLVEFFDVTRPTGAVKERWKGEDDPVSVWPFLSDDLCGLLAATAPLWAGTTDWQGTDNEVFGLGDGPGANSFGLQARGTVANLTTGEELGYQAVVRSVVSPSGDFKTAVSDVKLR